MWLGRIGKTALFTICVYDLLRHYLVFSPALGSREGESVVSVRAAGLVSHREFSVCQNSWKLISSPGSSAFAAGHLGSLTAPETSFWSV